MGYPFVIVAIISAAVFAALIVLFLVEHKFRQAKERIYLKTMSMLVKGEDTLEALKLTQDLFNPKSPEYEAIDEALYYLEHSIMRDYQSAFHMIEKTFKHPKVRELHQNILEKEKCNAIRLLTVLKETE